LVTEELKENVNSEVPDGRLFRFSAPHEKFSRCDSIPDTWKFCGLAEKLGGGIYIYIYIFPTKAHKSWSQDTTYLLHAAQPFLRS